MRWQKEHGYSMAFWAMFIAFVAVPMMALLWDASRYMDLRGELQMAADAAAVAAAQEVDVPHFRQTGEVRIGPGATGAAYATAEQNFARLRQLGYRPYIAYIDVNQRKRIVYIGAGATMHIFFPNVTPAVHISVEGMAQARMTTH